MISLTQYINEAKTVDVTELGDEIHSKVAEIIHDGFEKGKKRLSRLMKFQDRYTSKNTIKDVDAFLDELLKLEFIDNELSLKPTDDEDDKNFRDNNDINSLINSYPEREEDTVGLWDMKQEKFSEYIKNK